MGDVNWQIAVERDTQEGYALEVEQCACPPGYTGLSCEDCAPGYERAPGPYLGVCVPRRAAPQISCGPGAVQGQPPSQDGRCVCKANVQGPQCDRCAANTFNLSPRNPQGCHRCWCAGVTPTCDSSSFRRSKVEVDYGRGAQDRVEITTDDVRQPFTPPTQPQVSGDSIRFDGFQEARGQTLYWKLPIKFAGDKVTSYGGNLNYVFRCSGDGQPNRSPDVIIRGNNVVLHHNTRQQHETERDNSVSIPITEQSFTRSDGQQSSREDLLMALADVDEVLVKSSCVENTQSSSLTSVSLDYAEPYGSGELALDVEQCRCPEGYVGPSCEDCAPGYSRVQGGPYLGLCQKCDCNGHASQCDSQYGTCIDCQHNTEGDHCERCLPGFTGDARRGTPYDCQAAQTKPPCQCYNHSPRGCDSFGRCLLCEHSTEGFHCEACKKGYYGDATRGTPYDCTPCPCPGASDCYLDQQGQVTCRNCPAGYAGRLCDECAPGYSKSANTEGRDCEPTGRVASDHKEFVPPADSTGLQQQQRFAQSRHFVVHHPGRQQLPTVAFSSGPTAHQPAGGSGRLVVQILPPKALGITEGSRAKWVCHVTGEKPENVDLTWTKIGVQELPPHVEQRGNQLVIEQVRASDQGYYRCTGTSKTGAIASDEGQLTITQPRTAPFYPPATPQRQEPVPQPVVTPPHQTVDTHQSATFTCLVPGFADCEVVWHFQEVNGPLPPGVHRRGNQLYIPQAEQHHAGNYICTVRHQYGQAVSNPGRLEVNRPEMRPIADPPLNEVSRGDPARFRCWVPTHPEAKLTWRTENGGPLPDGVEAQDGILHIHSAEQHHAQRYICSATDPARPERGPVDANPVELRIRQPHAPTAPQVDPLHQTVTKGKPARIRCWVPGKPDAQVRWSVAGGGALPEGAHDRNGVLEFPSVQEAHANSYVCSVYDPQTGQPIDSPEAKLDVREPVKPQVTPPEQVVSKGDPAEIRCWVPGVPDAQLRWHRRGGQPLLPGSRDDGRGNLHIASVDSVHQGDYECTAYDPVDRTPQVSDPATITLKQAEPEEQKAPGQPPRPVATPPVITVPRGTPARFHCDANSQTPADIHWGFGDPNGSLRDGVVQEGDDVVIDSADEQTAGEYFCTATNEFGTGSAQPVRLVLTDQEVPPTARVEPKVWEGKPGETHQFKCIVTGTPTPQIHWTGPNGGALPDDVVDLGDGVLEISNAKKSTHEGTYTCTATNVVGEASDTGEAKIEPSLNIVITPHVSKLILTVGEPLEIKCEAFGEPDPEVEWLHDPGPERGDLPDDYVPVMISEQFIRHPSVGLGNAGRYTCKGSNQFSTVTKDIYVEVIEPSHIATIAIIGGNNQWFPTGQPAQILCTATGGALVDELQWTRNDGGMPDGVEEHNEPGLLHFESFKSGDEGVYECRAIRKGDVIASSSVHVYADNHRPAEVAQVEISAPTVRVVNKGESIVLDCVPPLEFRWLHGESSQQLREVVWSPRRILALQSVGSEHAGVFYVQAILPSGRILTSRPAFVVVRNTKPDGGHQGDLSYRWSKARGGALVKHLGTEPQLTIKSADPTNDYGIYRCEVEDGNSDTLGSAQVAVSVGYDSGSTPEEAKFEEESEAVIICPVFTVPGATVSWSKQDGDLPADSIQAGNKLTIPTFNDESAGVYTCSVQYGHSTVEGFVHAKIFVPDTTIQVVLNVSSESVKVGDPVWLDCVVTGDSNAKIEFSKVDADALPKNAQVHGNRLEFTAVTEEDAGKYQCRAHVAGGFLDTTAKLMVEPAKRKRKHTNSTASLLRNQRRRLRRRHRRRHSGQAADADHGGHGAHAADSQHSVFGSWFASRR
ncbi:hypothetical protein M3Y99_01050000 [Aphelenchoides fujianensis]|nr:hypothetical protein M3Y99_01050000 [Aphelenchoides fujianensis]